MTAEVWAHSLQPKESFLEDHDCFDNFKPVPNDNGDDSEPCFQLLLLLLPSHLQQLLPGEDLHIKLIISFLESTYTMYILHNNHDFHLIIILHDPVLSPESARTVNHNHNHPNHLNIC